MYSLANPNFEEEFHSEQALIDAVLKKGVDPNYPLLFNGVPTGDYLIQIMTP